MADIKFEFAGDRDSPSKLTDVHARRPELGSGKRPVELEQLAHVRRIYTAAAEIEKSPPRVESIEVGKRKIQRVDVPLDVELGANLPGQTLQRMEPERVQEETAKRGPVQAYRPDWADRLYVPRKAAIQGPPALRRFDGSGVEPLYVFGNDDRWVFQDSSWPWGLAGRIFNNRGQWGTAALVGERTVITAGHVVPWGDSPWWMRFVPAFYDGQSLHGAGVESYVSDARGYNVSNVVGYDWAVLRLYEPLGDWLGYFGYNGYSSSWNDEPYWSIIGYPGMVANAQRPSFQGSITIHDTDSDPNGGLEIESQTADLTPGNSGGPMFAWWGNDPRIVGVVSGQERDYQFPFSTSRENVMAGGSGFTDLCAWARSNWPG